LTGALANARVGDVVEVPAGRYDAAHGESFPLVVPAGVTLRGSGDVVIDGGGKGAVVLGAQATLERVTVVGGAPGYMMLPPTCVTGAGDGVVVRACTVESILLSSGTGQVVEGNVVAGGKIWIMGSTASLVRANYQHGLRWGAGIELNGGAEHVVAENECRDDLCAIRLVATERTNVERNRYETRWFGIHVLDAHDTLVYRNHAWQTMRAVSIERCSGTRLTKQLAEHCDTGAVVERGATGTSIEQCWLHDCRVGILVWEAEPVDVTDCAISEPLDHAVVGPVRQH
jgi:nitrous oxidase accessory protein NosD